jgi:hypothetical protein
MTRLLLVSSAAGVAINPIAATPAEAQVAQDASSLLEQCIGKLGDAAEQVEGLSAEVTRKLEQCRARSRERSAAWQTIVEARIDRWLETYSAVDRPCEKLSYNLAREGRLVLKGKVANIDMLRDSLSPVSRSLPGIDISFDSVRRIESCLHVLANADGVVWGLPVSVDGDRAPMPIRGFNEVANDPGQLETLPPARLCTEIGRSVTNFRDKEQPDLAVRAFWVRASDGQLGLCQPQGSSGAWGIITDLGSYDEGLIIEGSREAG